MKQHFTKLFLFITLFLSAYTIKAQVATTVAGTGVNAFLQGNFMELGVSHCGTYGTETGLVVPAGFHPRFAGADGMGFVADVGRDGWSVGSPDFCGDYFLPGSPVEGWGLGFNGTDFVNTDRCFINAITGNNTSTLYTGTDLKNVWEGSISGMNIKQESYFPLNALYIVTKVYLTNTTTAPMTDVVYVRNVDPDNDQPISGDFTTTNTVVSQPNISNCDALVTAVGLSPGCFLGLGARSQNARVGVGGFSTVTPLLDYYTTLRDTTTGHLSTSDEAISIMFYWPTVAPGQTVVAAFAYVLEASDLAVALESTGGAMIYSDSADITASLRDTICPNDTLQLVIESDTSYDWTWSPNYRIDTLEGNIVTVFPDVTTTYTAVGINGPCGTIIRNITITASPSVRVNAGPDQTICLGRSATIRATNASSFTWSPTSTLSPSTGPVVTASPVVNTTYIVSSNCGLDTVNINVVPNYAIQLSKDTALCLGQSAPLAVSLIPSQPFTISWFSNPTLSDTTIVNPIATPTTNTTYRIQLSSTAGCVRDTFINVAIKGVFPDIDIAGKSPICLGDSTQFYAGAFSPRCGTYSQSKEPYAPLFGSGTVIPMANDSNRRVPLGFNFNFFCKSFDSITVTDKGYLTFTNTATNFFGPNFIPSIFAPNDMIAFAWSDFDPTLGGFVDYRTEGTAPNRKFVINFVDQHQFSPTDSALFTQIILYETSNVIEIHTFFSNVFCSQGIEDNTGTNSLVVAGRNFVNMIIRTPECRRLTPSNLSGPVTYSWAPSSVVVDPNANPATVVTSTPVTLTVTVSDNGCSSTATKFLLVDSSLQIYAITPDTTLCSNQLFPMYVRSYYDSVDRYFTNCSRYDVASIPYNLITGSGTSIDLFDLTYTFNDFDDGISKAIPIGFSFPFYCDMFDSLYVTGNGYVTFSPPNTISPFPQFLPDFFDPNHLIAVHWDNLNMNLGGALNYRTIGTAPNRKFIINFEDIQMWFGGAYKGQLVLNEADSSIEIHHTYSNGSFSTTCGVENEDGTDATTPVGRNQSFWNLLSPEAWKFKHIIDLDPARTLTYSWTPTTGLTGSNTSDPIANITGPITYFVEINDGYCKEKAAVTINSDPAIVNAGVDTTICSEYNLQLNASGVTSYSWFPAIGLSAYNISNPISYGPNTMMYIVTGTNASGCTSVDTITIIRDSMLCPDVNLAIPNAFTPNGDGLNDYFYPLISRDISVKEFRIFNRWGDIVYDNATAPGWDGKILGQAQPIGTYVYHLMINYPDVNQGGVMVSKIYTGSITLVR